MKILIVDDEPGTRLLVSTALQRLGHSVLQASDGTEGWQAFALHRPEVVITDWAMPGMDGTELTARIRAIEGAYTYIMVLSARADEHASREAVQAGADDVLTKPPDPNELERGLIAAQRLTALHRRLSSDARQDALTGAGSRLRLDEDLAAVCARVKRYGHAYCLAMIGLEPGDEDNVRRAGVALGQEIRSGDVLYRSGKAQFVVLLPEQGLETANLAANRLQTAAEHAAQGAQVSVGMVTTGTEPEPEALLLSAEAALQRAAESGGIVGQGAELTDALRLLVADDDPVSRLMLAAILKREPGFEVVGEAEDATSAVELALRRRPDVVLLDVNMPGGGGARAAVQIRESHARRADRGDQRRRFPGLSVRHDARGRGGLHHEGLVGRRDPARDQKFSPLVTLRSDDRGRAEGKRLFDVRRERSEVARDAGSPAVPDFTLAAAGGTRQSALTLPAVDDHRHVGIVLVVALELGIELVRKGFWYDAVDHVSDPSPLAERKNSVMC